MALHSTESPGRVSRLAYTQSIGLMEAYLGDTLIHATTSSSVLRRIAGNAEELKKEKLALADVLENPNVATDRVRHYLRDIRYHNLAKVTEVTQRRQHG